MYSMYRVGKDREITPMFLSGLGTWVKRYSINGIKNKGR